MRKLKVFPLTLEEKRERDIINKKRESFYTWKPMGFFLNFYFSIKFYFCYTLILVDLNKK